MWGWRRAARGCARPRCVACAPCAGNIIYPNDTIRRRLQFNGGGESYGEAARSLLRDGGLARLYKGCLLYNLKVAPAAAMQFATYYGLKELMTRYS